MDLPSINMINCIDTLQLAAPKMQRPAGGQTDQRFSCADSAPHLKRQGVASLWCSLHVRSVGTHVHGTRGRLHKFEIEAAGFEIRQWSDSDLLHCQTSKGFERLIVVRTSAMRLSNDADSPQSPVHNCCPTVVGQILSVIGQQTVQRSARAFHGTPRFHHQMVTQWWDYCMEDLCVRSVPCRA